MDSFFGTVLVRGYKPDGGLAYGSGVVVEKDKVLTNCHIFRQTKQPWVSQGDDSYSIVSVQADRWHDICLVSTHGLPIKPVAIGSSEILNKGEEVIAIGHSSGVPAPLTSLGSIKSLYLMDGAHVIRSTARFTLGASGSGLFDGQGRLVGINTFKTPGRVAYFYSLPVEWLKTLKQRPAEEKFPIVGKAFWEEDDNMKPFFMQMALPEIAEDWQKLAEVTARWTAAEPGSTEAWYESGFAYEQMGMQDKAETAYRKSVALDALNTDALFRIGIIASKKGNKQEVRAINLALLDIDKVIAEEFSKAAGCQGTC